MTYHQRLYQMKELLLTGIVASTMILLSFTSCQSKDEKAVIRFVRTEYQQITFQKALKYFGINQTELAEQMTDFLLQNTEIEVVSHAIKKSDTLFVVKVDALSSEELYQALQLFAHHPDQFDFSKMKFKDAIALIEKNEGRSLAKSESFIKVLMKNNPDKSMVILQESSLIDVPLKLSQDKKSNQNRYPASLKK